MWCSRAQKTRADMLWGLGREKKSREDTGTPSAQRERAFACASFAIRACGGVRWFGLGVLVYFAGACVCGVPCHGGKKHAPICCARGGIAKKFRGGGKHFFFTERKSVSFCVFCYTGVWGGSVVWVGRATIFCRGRCVWCAMAKCHFFFL